MEATTVSDYEAWVVGWCFVLRPMMVPMLHTNGITAYALADTRLVSGRLDAHMVIVTLMFRSLDQLSDHSLNDANIAVERTADYSTSECNPEIRS